MEANSYLNGSVKDGYIMRWSINPLAVYIAPMRFYSKPGEDFKYRKMVMDALQAWSNASGGKITFKITNVLLESNINIDWRRVDRKSLGHCNYNWDPQGRLYGAEVSIGLTDGRVHKSYDNDAEVYHTILHEIGHALGLGHSPYSQDIMYTPHQYGNSQLSVNDKYSIKWLYKLQSGASVKEIASKYKISTSTDIDSVIKKIDSKNNDVNKQVKNLPKQKSRDLMQEAENIGDLKRYNLMLQNIALSDNIKKCNNNLKNGIK